MKNHIDDLAGVNKVWNKNLESEVEKTWHSWPPTNSTLCRSALADWKLVLDVRVPSGYQNYVRELVDYGRQFGIEVRVFSDARLKIPPPRRRLLDVRMARQRRFGRWLFYEICSRVS